ncbi:MAG TPA: hypothetical protein GX010_03350 [Erysipelotrichaceae bacterium]|nr:hypothetical protein [Erysipelotrichaceae bacterium]
MDINTEQIMQYVEGGLLGLFLLILLTTLVSALIGFKKGIWKSTYRMLFMFSLVFIALLTLGPLTNFISSFDLSKFLTGEFYVSRVVEGETFTYYIPVTSVKETIGEIIKGLYVLFNVSVTEASATNFALAVVDSVLKIVVFIVDMVLIVTLGNLFCFIMWHIAFKRIVPKAARKIVKFRWVAAIEHAVTYFALAVLFFIPFTSILNSVNQAYQRNRPDNDNEIILTVGNFIDAYNNSLFAQVFFNWTVDDSGMTLDTRLFDSFTTGVSGDVAIGLVSEIANLTDLAMVVINGLEIEGEEFNVEPTSFITKEVVNSVFDSLGKSQILGTVLPLAVEVALNSDILSELLENNVPKEMLNIGDFEWKSEVSNLKEMANCLFDSGVVDLLFVEGEDGRKTLRNVENEQEVFLLINDILYSENFDSLLEVFRLIDKSKIISRVLPVLINIGLESDETGEVRQFLPLSWEQLNEISWGYECYVLLDFLHQAVTLDDDFFKAILVQTEALTPSAGEEIPALSSLISEYAEDFRDLLVGKVADNQLINVDKYGRTIVFDNNGERIEGRKYCLFDMSLMNYILPNFMTNLFDYEFLGDLSAEFSEADINSYKAAVAILNTGEKLKNYKKEFHAILSIVTSIAENEELLNALMSENGLDGLMVEEGNPFSIEKRHIQSLQTAMSKIDDSILLYNILTPVIKTLITDGEFADTLSDIGLDVNVIASAIDHDMRRDRENRQFFTDLSSLFDKWDDLAALSTLFDGGDGSDALEKLNDRDMVDSLVSVLKVLYENPIINPVPEAGDTYVHNENLYGMLGSLFDNTADIGLVVPRATLEEVADWSAEFEAFGDIIYYIASHDILNAADVFEGGMTREALESLKDPGEGHIDLPGFLTIIGGSYIFSQRLGPFLDEMLGDALSGFLIDTDNGVCFSNIKDWEAEAINIRNLLNSLCDLFPEDDDGDLLSNFDIANVTNVIELNKMLHELANSGVFTYIDSENVTHYQFGKWLYSKMNDLLSEFEAGDDSFDLLADPVPKAGENWSWNPEWGIRPGDAGTTDPYFAEWHDRYYDPAKKTHYIAYRDFVSPEGIDDDDYTNISKFWCDYDSFIAKHNNFKADKGSNITNTESLYYDNPWGSYFADPDFISDYDDYELFDVDEISRFVKFMSYVMRLVVKDSEGNLVAFDNMDTELIGGLLTSINDTTCLRMSIYNFYLIASDAMLSGYSAFNLSTARNVYMVDCNKDIQNFDLGRPARQDELNVLINFYDIINSAKDDGGIIGGDFDFSKMNEEGFVSDIKEALSSLNNSFVFHRAGPSIDNQPTTFQRLFHSMLDMSEMKNIVYLGDDSPKDKAATQYANAEDKVKYLVLRTFLTDDDAAALGIDIDTSLTQQSNEIDLLMEAIEQIYSLVDTAGQTVADFASADMSKSDNLETIENLFNILNSSGLLYDCVPNTLYNMLVKNNQLSISSGALSVEFNRVDPFYHYYYNDNVLRPSVNFEARYLVKDISNIMTILEDYQDFNELLAGGSVSAPQILADLIGVDETEAVNGPLPNLLKHMHDSNLFHTPARNYPNVYYTNKFDGDSYTLFEELMAKVCSFVGLDTFAYDAAHDIGYATAEAKLRAKVKLLTRADDDNLLLGDTPPYYHNEEGKAWTGANQEIDSIMLLANEAITLDEGSASLDLSSFSFNEIAPNKVEALLHRINNSDLISDAVPSFIKGGFAALNIDNLLTYNEQNYAYYYLGQGIYGGDAVGGTDKGEISTICNAMSDLYDETGSQYIANFTNFTTLAGGAEADKHLGAILRLIYNSRILNTSLAGNYNEYNVVESQKISAQGILLYNAMGDTVCSYVARDADESTPARTKIQKIAVLSKIAHMIEYIDETHAHDTPAVEAQGIRKLITSIQGNLDATTFGGGDTETIQAKKALILGIVESAYNAESAVEEADYRRSAIVSEFVAGLFNTILENQYHKLETDAAYASYVYELFSFGEDDAELLTFASYDKINVIERDGLEGLLDSLADIKDFASLLVNPEKIAHLKECFTKMGRENNKNSEIARALYLTEAHSYFKVLGLSPAKHPIYFIPVDETKKDPLLDNNIYSNTFSFKEYGDRVETYANA